MPHSLNTAARRALQPLWNGLDGLRHACVSGVVLAVSGGPDSLALLEAWVRYRHRTASVVCVVDHGRRASSSSEALAVCTRAKALGMDALAASIVVERGDEASLRHARYDALQQAARDRGFGAIMLAHHRGDVAEGVLLHLTGQGGGRGGRAPRAVEVHDSGIARLRPFLGLAKADLQRSLDSLGIGDAVIDEDDLAGKNARGRLRLNVLGPLAAARSAVEVALARHALRLREDDDFIEAQVPDVDVVDAALPPAVLRRWLRRRIGSLASDPRTGPGAIDTVLRLASTGQSGCVSVRGGIVQIRRSSRGHEVAVEAGAGHSQKQAVTFRSDRSG